MSAIHLTRRSFGPSGPTVSANTGSVSFSSPLNPTHAGVEYKSNGTEDSSGAGGAYTIDRGIWLDTGLNSEVWIERTIDLGTLQDDAGAGRLIMTSNRKFACRDSTIPGGPVTATVTFDFWDAASGGSLLDTVTLNFSANRESGA